MHTLPDYSIKRTFTKCLPSLSTWRSYLQSLQSQHPKMLTYCEKQYVLHLRYWLILFAIRRQGFYFPQKIVVASPIVALCKNSTVQSSYLLDTDYIGCDRGFLAKLHFSKLSSFNSRKWNFWKHLQCPIISHW